MALDRKAQAALALHRFGFGPRPGSIAAISADPQSALLAEIDRPNAGQILHHPELLASAQAARAAYEDREARQAKQTLAQRAQKEAERQKAMAGEAGGDMSMEAKAGAMETPAAPKPEVRPEPPLAQQILRREAKARIDAALGADIGFAERLAWFWSNHFCVNADKVPAMAGGYEREAIRPFILGRFADMLLTAESHPAMLFYLDNAASIGPNSVAGINRSRGLNENLAREILELHTLGVRSGYTQDDVTRFAYVLTGWTIIPVANDPERGGEFVFNRRLHEPGPQQVIGKTYADGGVEQGRAVLGDLARHPATATHVATKLARHFVADEPPPALVERLAKVFRETDGDLKQMSKALVTAPEAWSEQRPKLKRPAEWTIAALRVVGITDADVQRMLQGFNLLGEPLWRPPAPKGFSDEQGAWLDGLALRIDIASQFATRVADRIDPASIVDIALGPLASAETRQTVARAESRAQALTLLLMSPEFQRR
jgi:uncharacterized protein (DUF1800 family)